jgi:hypothetical protein
MDASPVRVHHYAELLAVVRARKDELNISNETLDAIAGLSPGTASKILGPVPTKRMGGLWLFLICGALGLGVALYQDPEALARVQSRLVPRQQRNVRMRAVTTHDEVVIRLGPDFLHRIRRKGGLARAAGMSDRQRSAAARHAARARWRA